MPIRPCGLLIIVTYHVNSFCLTYTGKYTFAEQNWLAEHVLLGAGFGFRCRVRRFFHKHSVHPCVAHPVESLKRPQSLLILLVWMIFMFFFAGGKWNKTFPRLIFYITCNGTILKQNITWCDGNRQCANIIYIYTRRIQINKTKYVRILYSCKGLIVSVNNKI